MAYERILMNLDSTDIRSEMLEGEDHFVVPTVMLTVGVHNGSQGPLLYREEDMAAAPSNWDHKPIVVYHPELNGEGISACNPNVLNNQKVGILLNTQYEGKLKTESWLNKKSLRRVDNRVFTALEKKQKVEVSTGLFTKNVEETGEFAGEAYSGIATELRPDHLAILPDQVGACSIAKGAGLLQNRAAEPLTTNEMSQSNINCALQEALNKRLGAGNIMGPEGYREHCWICDVYSTFFVYGWKDELWRLNYTKSETAVEISESEPDKVVRVTEYRTVTGTYVGNASASPLSHREDNMPKKDLVDGLISNKLTQWVETDRATLMNLDEKVLERMVPEEVASTVTITDPPPTTNTTAPLAPVAPANYDQWLAAIPDARAREMIQNGVQTHLTQRTDLTARILANTVNRFTKEQLDTMDWTTLQNYGAVAAPSSTTNVAAGTFLPPLFNGAQGFAPAFNMSNVPELGLPVYNVEASADKKETAAA